MAYTGKIISGDCHVDIPWLPEDTFTSRAPAHLKDKVPHVVDTAEGKQWYAGDSLLGWVAGSGIGLKPGGWDPYVSGVSKRMDRMEETGFFSDGLEGRLHPTTPEPRLKDQDIDGVSGEVIYGILGLAGGLSLFDAGEEMSAPVGGDAPGPGYGISDVETITTVYEAYNNWLSGFCKTSPNRFAGLGVINGHDSQLAANQTGIAADLGLKGAEMNVSTAVKPIYHRAWDPLWEAAGENNMPISFHTIGLNTRMPDKSDMEDYSWMSSGIYVIQFQLSGAEFLSSIIYSGACDRFPNFKFVLGECGIGWIPYILYRMDDEYERQYFNLGLSLKPSEFWSRQGYSTFQIEYVTNELVSRVGEDNIMWGSDYPHGDGVWPDSRQVIQETLGHLDERVTRKIVCDNTAKLYGFQV